MSQNAAATTSASSSLGQGQPQAPDIDTLAQLAAQTAQDRRDNDGIPANARDQEMHDAQTGQPQGFVKPQAPQYNTVGNVPVSG